jgi:hypothetical protein
MNEIERVYRLLLLKERIHAIEAEVTVIEESSTSDAQIKRLVLAGKSLAEAARQVDCAPAAGDLRTAMALSVVTELAKVRNAAPVRGH